MSSAPGLALYFTSRQVELNDDAQVYFLILIFQLVFDNITHFIQSPFSINHLCCVWTNGVDLRGSHSLVIFHGFFPQF